jgi:hypothetical protein
VSVRKGETAEITFSAKAPIDAELSVVDAQGKIVRHLAAGMLGDHSPPPFSPGLKQKLTWDGTDDVDKPAAGGPFQVRLALGMKARLHRIYGWNGHWPADRNGMVCGPVGMLYVVHGGMWLPHRQTWLISAGPSNWGFKTNNWNVLDPLVQVFSWPQPRSSLWPPGLLRWFPSSAARNP